jgi:hypothetical protein
MQHHIGTKHRSPAILTARIYYCLLYDTVGMSPSAFGLSESAGLFKCTTIQSKRSEFAKYYYIFFLTFSFCMCHTINNTYIPTIVMSLRH